MGILRFLVEGALLTLLGIYLFFGLVYLFTGIRIKRVGYLSIRWIQWISRSERVIVEVRKIGLRPQRPSVTRRPWLGIVVSDATITVRPGPAEEDWESAADEEWPSTPQKGQSLEVTVTIRDLYFSINDKEFTEIAKTAVLIVDFLLGGDYGVRGVKAGLRIAGFSIPYDHLMMFEQRIT